MAFRGIFVGLDRYASPNIGWLSCARRDAVALDALFRNTLGEGGLLLVDEVATTQNIQGALADLASCDPDDVVVLFFSGHGAPSHHLISHDTDPNDLDRTGLALDELTERFTAIPARRLLCILDCCFSGGMGAKVLMPDVRARGAMGSTEESLAKMSGQGRVVLTASSASQEAWENATLGHGFLTYHLISSAYRLVFPSARSSSSMAAGTRSSPTTAAQPTPSRSRSWSAIRRSIRETARLAQPRPSAARTSGA